MPDLFPIQGNDHDGRKASIRWTDAEIICAEHKAQYGGSQTVDDYARRGGFGVYEAIKLATDAARRAQGKI